VGATVGQRGARVLGALGQPLVVDEGAQFDGKCAMSGEAKPMPNLVELKPEVRR